MKLDDWRGVERDRGMEFEMCILGRSGSDHYLPRFRASEYI